MNKAILVHAERSTLAFWGISFRYASNDKVIVIVNQWA